MCKFCELKYNDEVGMECGAIMLDGNNTVITKARDGKFILSDNVSSKDFPIVCCPSCSRDLTNK